MTAIQTEGSQVFTPATCRVSQEHVKRLHSLTSRPSRLSGVNMQLASRRFLTRSGSLLAAFLSMLVAGLATAATGRTPYSFEVSQTGEAQFSMPIWAPPGTAGMQPELAVSYNSSNGDDLLGMGFSVFGLSKIESCPRTIAQDGVPGGAASGRYCLDGQRLRLVAGTHGLDGAEYRTEIESFSRVKIVGASHPPLPEPHLLHCRAQGRADLRIRQHGRLPHRDCRQPARACLGAQSHP
jgi:hypothetical protein